MFGVQEVRHRSVIDRQTVKIIASVDAQLLSSNLSADKYELPILQHPTYLFIEKHQLLKTICLCACRFFLNR